MQAAVDALWPYTGEMFEMDEVDEALVRTGRGGRPRGPAPALARACGRRCFEEATLAHARQRAGCSRAASAGIHTEHLGYILAEMQFLQRAYPGATW